MWLYLSRSGALLNAKREKVETCWAGRGEGLNNPELQGVKGIGPLPEGVYTIDAPHDSKTTGEYTLRLVPDPRNDMRGRSSFAMHGASRTDPAESSHGCIIAPRVRREMVWESGDRTIKVVAD